MSSEPISKEQQARLDAANEEALKTTPSNSLDEAESKGVQVDRSIITDLSKIPAPISYNYRGVRTSYICYHPAIHGADPFSFDRALELFMKQWNDWWEVCELYQDEMVLSEKVTMPSLKRDLTLILKDIVRTRDVYVLEAAAMALWDRTGATQDSDGKFMGKSEKTERHEFPTMHELKEIGAELLSLDCGITLDKSIPKNLITKHTWSG